MLERNPISRHLFEIGLWPRRHNLAYTLQLSIWKQKLECAEQLYYKPVSSVTENEKRILGVTISPSVTDKYSTF